MRNSRFLIQIKIQKNIIRWMCNSFSGIQNILCTTLLILFQIKEEQN